MTNKNDAINEQDGLTKREYFAALAMQGILPNESLTRLKKEGFSQVIAQLSIQTAGALIAELNKGEKE